MVADSININDSAIL